MRIKSKEKCLREVISRELGHGDFGLRATPKIFILSVSLGARNGFDPRSVCVCGVKLLSTSIEGNGKKRTKIYRFGVTNPNKLVRSLRKPKAAAVSV
ncbi:MAG: hypothetical protein U1C57_04170 [Candidatus Doudnabacteria bacterium]|nr:hypothetical protein [bacterium]MDZ4244272.1 hypothetical protein [Candidatus Doudnabacteria bacterium]